MKLVTFSAPDAHQHAGVFTEGDARVVDLSATGDPRLASVQAL